ncbi:jg21797 [Pararge aegeria aegeria]|uniref:Jg21797 protein n=1 Tax=Pararge aegeria aegeria TaxID=348720 RepID=A0A8S4S296_9NEOP|nr:jg21797 [Pararge aegeria aegeria]
MTGKIKGEKRVGSRRKTWLRDIREWTEIANVTELLRFGTPFRKRQEIICRDDCQSPIVERNQKKKADQSTARHI